MEIIERLKRWVKLKPGDVPEFHGKVNYWEELNTDLLDAIHEIAALRGSQTNKQARAELERIGCLINAYFEERRIAP